MPLFRRPSVSSGKFQTFEKALRQLLATVIHPKTAAPSSNEAYLCYDFESCGITQSDETQIINKLNQSQRIRHSIRRACFSLHSVKQNCCCTHEQSEIRNHISPLLDQDSLSRTTLLTLFLSFSSVHAKTVGASEHAAC